MSLKTVTGLCRFGSLDGDVPKLVCVAYARGFTIARCSRSVKDGRGILDAIAIVGIAVSEDYEEGAVEGGKKFRCWMVMLAPASPPTLV